VSPATRPLIIITGLSGAGKSTALHALEDLGCFCTDNLPLDMLPAWARLITDHDRPAAMCVDIRSSPDPAQLYEAIQSLLQAHENWRLLYIDASQEALLRRFSTLRRRHPFSPKSELIPAIRAEREAMRPLRELADLVLDSSSLTPYELAAMVESYWRQLESAPRQEITMSLVSFSYQGGLPLDADMVVDMRFLPNPHYEPGLAGLTGRDEPVREFLERHQEVNQAARHLCDWLGFIWPMLKNERKQYFTLAIGCSGGRHRSVYMVERLADWMQQEHMAVPLVRHRELTS